MKGLLILALPWSLIVAGSYALVRRVLRWRREDRQREVLRRRVNRHTLGGDNAA